MPIVFNEQTKTFFLNTDNTTYAFCVFDKGYLMSLYWGKKIAPTADLTRLWRPFPCSFAPVYPDAPDRRYSLEMMQTEYPVYGSGDYCSPALSVQFEDGNRLVDLLYQSHTVTAGNTEPQGMPGLSGGEQTLEVLLKDPHNGLEVSLVYTVFPQCDIITRRAVIHNATGEVVKVERALSANIALQEADYEVVDLYGSHCRERFIERTPLHHGIHAFESRRGTSSHQQNPFIALVSPSATEFEGDVYGAALVYSGNFLAQAQVSPYDTTRVQLGIHPTDFCWKLEQGESFHTPEAVLTYSANGMNRMSQNFHNAIRNHLGHSPYRNRVRPIVINNWEGTYFDFNEELLLSMIDSCKGLGVDTFVLDDGWFGTRNGEIGSLGDWVMNRTKLPNGLTPLIEKCESQGMTFGLWLEPEMVSENSDLLRAHPDWFIHYKDRPYSLGRNQLILDLTRDEVLEHLKQTIGDILRNNRISYIKWDMNRHFTDAYSAALPVDRQSELFHRYVLNLYALMDYLTTTFPQVLFEGCSGGGGRFDMGILYYSPQIWTSDDSDAIERLRIQYGTSVVYPPLSMTGHVSACPNHQVFRNTPFATRAAVAMSASFGYELDPRRLSEEERAQIAEQTAHYKKWADLIVNGDFYRLLNPFTADHCAWCFVSPDKERAIATYVRRLTRFSYWPLLKFAGLDPNARYHIAELQADFGGDELMYAGIATPEEMSDFESQIYTLTKIS